MARVEKVERRISSARQREERQDGWLAGEMVREGVVVEQ
jgi:hypothetical protein